MKHTVFGLIQHFDLIDHERVLRHIVTNEPNYVVEALDEMHALGEAEEAAQQALATPWMRSVIEHLDKNEIVAAIKAIRTNTGMGLFEAKCVADVLRGKSRKARVGLTESRPLADVCVRCLDQFDEAGLFVSIMSLTADGRHQLDDGTNVYDYNRKIADCESTTGEWVSADTGDESLSRHVVDGDQVADIVEACTNAMRSIDLSPIFQQAKVSDVIELQHSLSRSADLVNELQREVDELRSSLGTNDNHVADLEHQYAKAQDKIHKLTRDLSDSQQRGNRFADWFNTADQFWQTLYPMVEKYEPNWLDHNLSAYDSMLQIVERGFKQRNEYRDDVEAHHANQWPARVDAMQAQIKALITERDSVAVKLRSSQSGYKHLQGLYIEANTSWAALCTKIEAYDPECWKRKGSGYENALEALDVIGKGRDTAWAAHDKLVDLYVPSNDDVVRVEIDLQTGERLEWFADGSATRLNKDRLAIGGVLPKGVHYTTFSGEAMMPNRDDDVDPGTVIVTMQAGEGVDLRSIASQLFSGGDEAQAECNCATCVAARKIRAA